MNAKENYKPYLYSSKLSQAEEFIDLKERLELDLLELERRISLNENLDASEGLKLYGSDFFDTFQTSFMPINEPNPVSDYSLDIGDVLNIQLVGQLDNIDDYIINGDGSISRKILGKINVAGLTLSEASALIKLKISSLYVGIDAYISLRVY